MNTNDDIFNKFAKKYSFLSRDDWIYAGLLVGSFALALGQRFFLRGPFLYTLLRNCPGFIGFTASLFILGWKVVYSLPVALFAIVVVKFGPQPKEARSFGSQQAFVDHLERIKRFPVISFIVIFTYLLITRHLHEFVNVPELASQANALQLIITLRAIGLIYDVFDTRYNTFSATPIKVKGGLRDKNDVSLLTMFNFLYHYCGLFTGPYYSFQMYIDSSDRKGKMFHMNYFDNQMVEEYRWRVVQLAYSLPLFIIVNKYFPLDGLRTDDVFEWSMLYKLFYACMVFVVFRMRVYAAWAVSECICVTINIGIYPVASAPKCLIGPTDMTAFATNWYSKTAEANSAAIQNIDVSYVEASEGFRLGIRGWNKSVQTWLATYVHSRSPPAIRMVLTMFVSALWHGTYAGYFMSFLVVPMCTAAEDVLFRLFPVDPETGNRTPFFYWPYFILIRCRGFDFMATGFLLKNWKDTHRYWSSLYYWLPITMIILFIIASVIEKATKKRNENPTKRLRLNERSQR